jgi:glycosyltransferase EpsE
MKKRISILMGIYNCAATLPEAIDSILAQTCTDWELILCDDGSKDNTYAVAQVYQAQHPHRIKLLQNNRNMGLNHTLNRCLAAAEGEFIARMDGDDISLPNRLETELQFLLSHPEYAIVSSGMIYFDEHGDWGTGGIMSETPVPSQLVHGTVHCHAPCMVRREAMLQVGGYSEDTKLLRVEDWHLWLKMYAAGFRGYNLPQALYKMRDDRAAYHRRKFRYRLNESHVSRLAVTAFHLPLWMKLYSLRPIIVGLLPGFLYNILHKKRLNNH